MTRERFSVAQGAEAGGAPLNWLDPALIGNGSQPPAGGAHQDPAPPYGVSKELRELGEALKPWGFRWPQPKPSPEGNIPGSAESLFLRAGQSAVAYMNWKHSTRHQLRTARLFLLMRQGWSTDAIQDAISEVALASWWLSGEAVNWGYDPINRKASHTLVAFLHTNPAKIEAGWQQRLQQAQQAQRTRSASPPPPPAPRQPQAPRLSSTEVIAQLEPHLVDGFKKQLYRAAGRLRKNGQQQPVRLGGASKQWVLVELGSGGHRGAHVLQRIDS
ncbi:MAG: hypothetical protein ACKOPT_10270 [Cyanobium sp.]